MTNSIIAAKNSQEYTEVWFGLRQAISKSSGFQSWQQERNIDNSLDLDLQVRRYLKETLQTLAY